MDYLIKDHDLLYIGVLYTLFVLFSLSIIYKNIYSTCKTYIFISGIKASYWA